MSNVVVENNLLKSLSQAVGSARVTSWPIRVLGDM